MSLVEVTLPSLGEDAGDTAEVSFWYYEVGEEVAAGDSLLQMLTDKATFDVPSPQTGVVRELRAQEGDKVKVGDVICVIDNED